nr:aminotransferase class I/II-fold pyridoxal phosphate-dependent enzyme [Clavibacter sp. VKM Ac-2873]
MRRLGHLKWTHPATEIGLSVAEMDFMTSPTVSQAILSAVTGGQLGYPSETIEAGLKTATALWLAENYGWHVSAQDVQLVPDVVRAYHVAIERFCAAGADVIVPVPAYPAFLSVPRMLGRRVITTRLDLDGNRYAMDMSSLEQALKGGDRLLVLCNPGNPTGTVFTREELLAISELVEQYGARVFSDEIHAPLVLYGSHTPYASVSAAAASHCLTAVSASKAWNIAGLKCAQVIVSNGPDRDTWKSLNRLWTDGASTLGMIAATAAYCEGGEWLDDVKRLLRGNRTRLEELLVQHLPGVEYHPSDATYFAWLGFGNVDGVPSLPARHFRERVGVDVVEGREFDGSGADFVRLNFATSRANIESGVARIARSLR